MELINNIDAGAIFTQAFFWVAIIAVFMALGVIVFLVVRFFMYNIKVVIRERAGSHWIIKNIDRAREFEKEGLTKLRLYKARKVIKRFDDEYFLPYKKNKFIDLCLVEGNFYPTKFKKVPRLIVEGLKPALQYVDVVKSQKEINDEIKKHNKGEWSAVAVKTSDVYMLTPEDYDVTNWRITEFKSDKERYTKRGFLEQYGQYVVLGGLLVLVFLIGFFTLKYTNESVSTIMGVTQDIVNTQVIS